MSRAYFLSDLHFGAHHDDELQPLIRSFFEHVSKTGGELYIIGDYFDFWFEYREAIPKACLTGYHELERLRESGTVVHYLLGNHDQWALDLFEKSLGINVYRAPFRRKIADVDCYLHHGDGVSRLDGRYGIFKKIFHNTINRFMYRWVHPDIGLPLGRWFSHRNKEIAAGRDKYTGDVSFEPWLNALFADGVEAVIMGHHHVPLVKAYGRHRYINLGDWPRHSCYLEIYDGHIELKQWKS